MSYSVEVGPQAIEDLARLPVAVQRAVLEAMRLMAAEPTRRSRPAPPPYPPGMLYREDIPVEGVTCLLDVVFRYAQDEQTLHVDRVFVEYI